MTIDRTEASRALAKAIAFKNCGKDAEARYWAAQLLGILLCADILDPSYARGEYASTIGRGGIMKTTGTTPSREVAADIAALLRARNPLIWILSREEARVESYLIEAAASAGYTPHMWDVAQGVADLSGRVERIGAEQLAGRTVDRKAVAQGLHAHGEIWHDHH